MNSDNDTPKLPENKGLPDPEKEGKKYIKTKPIFAMKMDKEFKVNTLEGETEGKAGDYLCKGITGELWPVDSQIFESEYKQIEESPKYNPEFASKMANMTPEEGAKLAKEFETKLINASTGNVVITASNSVTQVKENIKLSKPTVSEDEKTKEIHDKDVWAEESLYTSVYIHPSTGVSKDTMWNAMVSGVAAFEEAVKNVGLEPDVEWPPEWDNPAEYDEPMAEGISPLSHDSSPQRAIRKHMTPRSRRHMKGSNRYRRADPAKRVLARLKRVSRHQPKPEVEEAFSTIRKYWDKTVTESELTKISDKQLLLNAVELLTAMAFGGWAISEDGISNGSYVIGCDGFSAVDGQLLYNNKPLKLNWSWLYEFRQLLRNIITNNNKASINNLTENGILSSINKDIK